MKRAIKMLGKHTVIAATRKAGKESYSETIGNKGAMLWQINMRTIW